MVTPRERADRICKTFGLETPFKIPRDFIEAEIEDAILEELEDAAKICDRNAVYNHSQYEFWYGIASNKDEMGVLKWAAWKGQAQRDATAIRNHISKLRENDG
jgi:hypothetical protein